MQFVKLTASMKGEYKMELYDLIEQLSPSGSVHCPNGGVCNAGSKCANTSHTEIENNDNNLQFNSGATNNS